MISWIFSGVQLNNEKKKYFDSASNAISQDDWIS